MKNLKSNIIRAYYRSEGYVKKHSPEILLGIGVAGVVAGTISACKASTKLESVLSESKAKIQAIKEVGADAEYADVYSPEDVKKDLTITYIQMGVKIIKLYTPAVALGAFSLSCIFASNNIMRKRNIAISAAYATVDKSFKEYRNRVSERFGDAIEKEIRYNIKAEEITKTTVDENGNEVTTTEVVKTMDPTLYSDYARFFDESCAAWQRDPEYNLMFLKSQQQYANDLLKAKGRLFLNDVYDMLGFEKTKAGQVVGWYYDTVEPTGDNFVDFGIYDMDKERVRAFVNGQEANILLDFNVDGNVWELM